MSFWGRFSILAGTVYRLGLRVNPELLAGGHSLPYRLILTPYQVVVTAKEVINKGVLVYALPLNTREILKQLNIVVLERFTIPDIVGRTIMVMSSYYVLLH